MITTRSQVIVRDIFTTLKKPELDVIVLCFRIMTLRLRLLRLPVPACCVLLFLNTNNRVFKLIWYGALEELLPNSYSACILGNPAVSGVVDIYEKGIRNYDIEKAFEYG